MPVRDSDGSQELVFAKGFNQPLVRCRSAVRRRAQEVIDRRAFDELTVPHIKIEINDVTAKVDGGDGGFRSVVLNFSNRQLTCNMKLDGCAPFFHEPSPPYLGVERLSDLEAAVDVSEKRCREKLERPQAVVCERRDYEIIHGTQMARRQHNSISPLFNAIAPSFLRSILEQCILCVESSVNSESAEA